MATGGGAPGPGLDYAAIAEQVIVKNRPLLALEFHPAAIAALDAFIDLTWGEEGASPNDDRWQPRAGKLDAIVGFGAFFGEVIRRELGGEWRHDEAQPDNPLLAQVALAGVYQVHAIGKVYARLRNGVEDRLEPLYRHLRQQVGAKALAGEAAGWIRQARHFEGVDRGDLATVFYERALALAPEPTTRATLEALRAKQRAAAAGAEAGARAQATAEARAQIVELAERGRRALVERGVRVDRASLALSGLDLFLDESFGREPLGDAQRQPPLEIALGAFLGELLCAHYRGEWREQPIAAVARSQVVWPSGLATCPFEVVARRLKQGSRAAIQDQVSALARSLRAQGDAEDPAGEPRDWFEQAEDYAQKAHRLDLAVRAATAGLGLGGDGAAVRLKLAAWCRALGQIDAAASHLDAALRMEAPGAAAWQESGALALARGRQPDALEAFERALALEPGNGEALLGKSRALVALKRMDEAREWLDAFAGRSDTEPERSYLAALAADAIGDRVAAHGLFSRLKDHHGLPAESRANAGARTLELAGEVAVRIAAIERMDLEQAVAEYGRLNAQHPDLAEPWRERGVGLVMLGRADEALECLRRAAALEPAQPKSYDHEAVTLARLKRLDEAVAALDRGLRACPASGLLLARKGIFLSMAGRLEEALGACEAALAADPAYAETWAFKGDIEHKLGRSREAAASLERYLAARPGSQEKRVEAARRQLWAITHPGQERDRERAQHSQNRGLQLAQAGRHGEALRSFDEAVAADPLFAEAWVNRATCLFETSCLGDAVASLLKAEELLGPTSPVANGLAACLLRLGRGEEALQAFDRLLALQPQSTEARRGKARTLVGLGRAREALPLYQRLLARTPEDGELAREYAEALRA